MRGGFAKGVAGFERASTSCALVSQAGCNTAGAPLQMGAIFDALNLKKRALGKVCKDGRKDK